MEKWSSLEKAKYTWLFVNLAQETYKGSSIVCDNNVKESVFTFVHEGDTWYKISYFHSRRGEGLEISPMSIDGRIDIEGTYANMYNTIPEKFKDLYSRLKNLMPLRAAFKTLEVKMIELNSLYGGE